MGGDAFGENVAATCCLVFVCVLSILAIVFGAIAINDGRGYKELNNDLAGSEPTQCQITWLRTDWCGRDGFDVSFEAEGIADLCLPYYNISIPWSGNVGHYDNCYKPSKAKLPEPGNGYLPGMFVDCRADCDKRVWYTDSPHDNPDGLITRGICLLVFPFVTCFIVCFYVKCCDETKSDKWDREAEERRKKFNIREEQRQQERRKEASREKKGFQKLYEKLQGDWSNSDGLLITVRQSAITFLPSGNSYKLEKGDGVRMKMDIRGEVWISREQDFAEEDTVIWRRMNESIIWTRRDLPTSLDDMPPGYEEAHTVEMGPTSGQPPVYKDPTAPPKYGDQPSAPPQYGDVYDQPPAYGDEPSAPPSFATAGGGKQHVV